MRNANLVSGRSYDQRADVPYGAGHRLPYNFPK
jgi:hypothetical protein